MGSIRIRCLETPFHTLGHICYLCSEDGSPERNIFTGDTLFIGGCGRCFAGTPQQMYTSLIDTLAKLPSDVKVGIHCKGSVILQLTVSRHDDDDAREGVLSMVACRSSAGMSIP